MPVQQQTVIVNLCIKSLNHAIPLYITQQKSSPKAALKYVAVGA
jgi:hypothetical protein